MSIYRLIAAAIVTVALMVGALFTVKKRKGKD